MDKKKVADGFIGYIQLFLQKKIRNWIKIDYKGATVS